MEKKKIITLIVSVIVIVAVVIGGVVLFSPNQSQPTITPTKSQDDELLSISGGTFEMGSPDGEAQRENDELQHEVTIDDFYISPYEVTQKEYQEIMGENPSQFTGDNLPVENVTWYDALNYCNALSLQEGLEPVYTIDEENVTWDRSKNGYRLPSEAEWEYACRATTSTPFNTENSISDQQANYYGHYPYLIEENYFSQDNLETQPGEYRETTIDVGSFEPNKWDLYDMHGNVGEWCYDYYGEYDLNSTNNPIGVTSSNTKVYRGGGWNDYAKHLRSSYRASLEPTQAMSNIGFRIVRNGDGDKQEDVVGGSQTTMSHDYSQAKILIAYFSWGGNTKNAAEMIQEKTGADIFEIEMNEPYSDDYNTVLDESQRDLNNDARPIINEVDNFDQYDVIMIGYPNWWATLPTPVMSFIENYDFTNKTIIPFCSHGGGGLGQSITDISKLAPSSNVESGLSIHYSGGSSLSSDIDAWLEKYNIPSR